MWLQQFFFNSLYLLGSVIALGLATVIVVAVYNQIKK